MGHHVVFLVFDGVKLLDVSGPGEVFSEAVLAGADYRLSYVSPAGRRVRTSIGTSLSVDGSGSEVRAADTVVIVGADRLPTRPIETDLLAAARHLIAVGGRIVSICTGAFVVAATGALDGHRATTHWEHARLLARAHPDIDVDIDAIFVHDGRFHTSAGVSAGIDLALSLVEADHGAELARTVARKLVVHLHRQGGQSQFSAALETPVSHAAPVKRAVDLITANPTRPHTLSTLSHEVGVSSRHLARLFKADLGVTPARLIESHRLELATNMLLSGVAVAETARRSGFTTPETLRRIFQNHFGVPPSVYRQRFSSANEQVHEGP